MSYTKVNHGDTESVGGALYFLRDPLGAERLGVSVLDCEPGWTGKEHDEAGGQEEVYVLVEDEATITVKGEDVGLRAGDALRVGPDATRQLRNGDNESSFVIVSAP